MKSDITNSLKVYYAKKFKDHGANSFGVDWGDEEKAEIRYNAMFNLVMNTSEEISILDVGSGYGGFYEFLTKRIDINKVNFSGIDIVEEMIDHAIKTYPKAKFLVGDVLNESFVNEKYDFIVCNGILTQKLSASDKEMEEYMISLIKKMFDLCKVGIAFNTMSDMVDFKLDGNFHYPVEKMFKLASSISRHIKIDHAYPLYEYTTYIYK